MILPYQNKYPKIDESVLIAEGAYIIGDVEIGRESSIWFNTVIRGDVNYIRIGERTNVQDLTMIHVTYKKFPTFIGNDISSLYLEGFAYFTAVFGLTGDFSGWFSNDTAKIPLRAKLQVKIGSVSLELKCWKRKNWKPPQY